MFYLTVVLEECSVLFDPKEGKCSRKRIIVGIGIKTVNMIFFNFPSCLTVPISPTYIKRVFGTFSVMTV